MGPVLVVVVQAGQCGVSSGGLGQHNLPCRRRGQSITRKPGNLRDRGSEPLTAQAKEPKAARKGLAPAYLAPIANTAGFKARVLPVPGLPLSKTGG